MALRIQLRPGERLLVGGTVIRNGSQRSTLWIESAAPVLREADILPPRLVRTPCERVYLALEMLYVEPARAAAHLAACEALAAEVRDAAPSLAPDLEAVDALVRSGDVYRALRRARTLLAREKELLAHVA
jgi:flagellar protein FlbT